MSPTSARSHLLPSAFALLFLLPLAACEVTVHSDEYRAREEKRFTVTGTPDVRLVTFDGSVDVRSWDRPEVLVEIEKTGAAQELVDAITVHADQDGQRITVEARRPAASDGILHWMRGSRGARIVASVPARCNLLARSGDGAVQAERVTGRIELRTGDGHVHGIDLRGDVFVETGDGSIKLEAGDGAVTLRTGDGSITAAGRFRAVQATTGDGSVVLKARQGSSMGEAWRVSTGDGGIVIYLPAGFDADVDARTDEGVVRVDEALGMGSPEGGDRRHLRGRMGKGGHVLAARTGDGSITVHTH